MTVEAKTTSRTAAGAAIPAVAFVLLGLMTVFWGVNFPVMKLALREIEPWTFRVVCLTAGMLLAETPTGNVEIPLRFGQSYARPLGVEHNIINPGVEEFAFVEIELK